MQHIIDFSIIACSIALCFALFCAVLYRWESSKKSVKYTLGFCVFLCGCGTTYYAYNQSIAQAKISEFERAFYENEILLCMQDNAEIHVHKTTFIYFEELLLFAGKDSMKGVNIPILACTQHIKTDDPSFIE